MVYVFNHSSTHSTIHSSAHSTVHSIGEMEIVSLHIYNMLFDLRVWDHCLSLAGTSTSEITVERLSGLSREVYVTELLGEESAQCESFFPHSSFDYETEANRFR